MKIAKWVESAQLSRNFRLKYILSLLWHRDSDRWKALSLCWKKVITVITRSPIGTFLYQHFGNPAFSLLIGSSISNQQAVEENKQLGFTTKRRAHPGRRMLQTDNAE